MTATRQVLLPQETHMDRKAREEKAALVRLAVVAMKHELKTASGQRKADLFHDMGLALTDLEDLEDFGDVPPEILTEKPEELEVAPSPLDEPTLFFEPVEEAPPVVPEPEPAFDLGVEREFCAGPQYMDDQIELMAGEKKEDSEPNDNTTAPGGEVPMGAMAEHSNVYAWIELENRQHVSYILDRVADITKGIEEYEHRTATAGKTAKSGSARQRVSSLMKNLAKVVNEADFKEATSGELLDAVGVQVMAMHKQLLLS